MYIKFPTQNGTTHSDRHTPSPSVTGCMDSAPNPHPSLCGFPPHSAEEFLLMAIPSLDSRSYYKKLERAIAGASEDRTMQDSSHPADGTTQPGKLSESLAVSPHSSSHVWKLKSA